MVEIRFLILSYHFKIKPMKAKNNFDNIFTYCYYRKQINSPKLPSKQNSQTKTVLLINTHLAYPGWSEGKLNASFYNEAKEFFISKTTKFLETKGRRVTTLMKKLKKHLQADIVILQNQ